MEGFIGRRRAAVIDEGPVVAVEREIDGFGVHEIDILFFQIDAGGVIGNALPESAAAQIKRREAFGRKDAGNGERRVGEEFAAFGAQREIDNLFDRDEVVAFTARRGREKTGVLKRRATVAAIAFGDCRDGGAGGGDCCDAEKRHHAVGEPSGARRGPQRRDIAADFSGGLILRIEEGQEFGEPGGGCHDIVSDDGRERGLGCAQAMVARFGKIGDRFVDEGDGMIGVVVFYEFDHFGRLVGGPHIDDADFETVGRERLIAERGKAAAEKGGAVAGGDDDADIH